MAEITGRTISLAGQTFRIRYTLEEKELILNAAPSPEERNLLKLLTSDHPQVHKALIYAGIRGANRKTPQTPDSIGQLMQEHNETGGWYDRDVLLPCIQEICDSRLLGYGANAEGIKQYLTKAYAETDAQGGKAGGAVTAAE